MSVIGRDFTRHCRRSVLRRIRLPLRIISMSWLQYNDNEANFRLGTHTNIMLGQRRRPRINIKLALILPSQRWNIFVKTMKSKMFSQFEIIIQVLVSSFFLIPMPWVYGHYQFFQCGDQNLTSIDVRFCLRTERVYVQMFLINTLINTVYSLWQHTPSICFSKMPTLENKCRTNISFHNDFS